jgi:hypothetical protein
MVKYGDFLHLLYYMRISFISSLIFSLKWLLDLLSKEW